MKLYDNVQYSNWNYRFKPFFLLLIFFLSSQYAISETQNKITFSGKNAALKEVFAEIEEQTDFSIAYEESDIEP